MPWLLCVALILLGGVGSGSVIAQSARTDQPDPTEASSPAEEPLFALSSELQAAIEAGGGRVRRIAESESWHEVSFHLSSTPLTDEVLARIVEVPALRWLSLQGTDVTDEMLRHVAQLAELTRLHLENTAITDQGVSHLAKLHDLEYLNLYGTKVSDASIDTLGKLQNLNQIYLWQTLVTEEGLKRLKELLPNTEVVAAARVPTPEELSTAQLGSNQLPGFVTGRFVRIELPGDKKILQLAEVEVLAADSGEALQSTGHASQSTTAFEAGPERAADGKTDQSFEKQSVSHTEEEPNPWWELDLKQPRAIGRIRIWNRGDCCGERLQGARLLVLDNQRQEVYSSEIKEPKTESWHEFP